MQQVFMTTRDTESMVSALENYGFKVGPMQSRIQPRLICFSLARLKKALWINYSALIRTRRAIARLRGNESSFNYAKKAQKKISVRDVKKVSKNPLVFCQKKNYVIFGTSTSSQLSCTRRRDYIRPLITWVPSFYELCPKTLWANANIYSTGHCVYCDDGAIWSVWHHRNTYSDFDGHNKDDGVIFSVFGANW